MERFYRGLRNVLPNPLSPIPKPSIPKPLYPKTFVSAYGGYCILRLMVCQVFKYPAKKLEK